jgi:hypothetical protein
MLLHLPICEKDVMQFDPEFYKQRVDAVIREPESSYLPWEGKNGLGELVATLGTPLTFVSACTDFAPEPQELKPGGADIEVTDENKHEYVRLLCEHHLVGDVRKEMQCLLQGFWDLLPLSVLRDAGIAPREISLLISGVSDFDVLQWQNAAKTPPGSDPQVTHWFWEVVREMSQEAKAKLLHFTTGSSRLPSGGFQTLQPQFQVSVNETLDGEHLPQSHTCFNQLLLCRYSSKEQLEAKLMIAMDVGEGFGVV